jgi:hypothetical protein
LGHHRIEGTELLGEVVHGGGQLRFEFGRFSRRQIQLLAIGKKIERNLWGLGS